MSPVDQDPVEEIIKNALWEEAGSKPSPTLEDYAKAVHRALMPATDADLVEMAAKIISPAFFGKSAEGWEEDLPPVRQAEARVKAQAILSLTLLSQNTRQPQVHLHDEIYPGDIVSMMTRAHPIMGEPYEVIGRVENSARGPHAGNRLLSSCYDIRVVERGHTWRTLFTG